MDIPATFTQKEMVMTDSLLLPIQYLEDRWCYSSGAQGPGLAEYEQLLADLLARVGELEHVLRLALQFRIGDPTGPSWFSIRRELERALNDDDGEA